MNKYLVFLIALMTSNVGWAQDVYFKCEVFDRSGDSTSAKKTVFVHEQEPQRTIYLADGIHWLKFQWWSWTLNVSVFEAGHVAELFGTASSSDVSLRSHRDVDLSVSCKKVN